ncbi:MAG: SlyX family protein [Paracoccaceae bacterium]
MKNIIIEEKISHILKTIDELSDIVAEHEKIIKISTARIEGLMGIIASNQTENNATEYFNDAKPPHY